MRSADYQPTTAALRPAGSGCNSGGAAVPAGGGAMWLLWYALICPTRKDVLDSVGCVGGGVALAQQQHPAAISNRRHIRLRARTAQAPFV